MHSANLKLPAGQIVRFAAVVSSDASGLRHESIVSVPESLVLGLEVSDQDVLCRKGMR